MVKADANKIGSPQVLIQEDEEASAHMETEYPPSPNIDILLCSSQIVHQSSFSMRSIEHI